MKILSEAVEEVLGEQLNEEHSHILFEVTYEFTRANYTALYNHLLTITSNHDYKVAGTVKFEMMREMLLRLKQKDPDFLKSILDKLVIEQRQS